MKKDLQKKWVTKRNLPLFCLCQYTKCATFCKGYNNKADIKNLMFKFKHFIIHKIDKSTNSGHSGGDFKDFLNRFKKEYLIDTSRI